MNKPSRREFLAAGAMAPAMFAAPAASGMLTIDYRKLVARGDLEYRSPVSRSEEGMPLGNGRMGTLVWTEGSSIRFQINRPDVFAMSSTTNSFPERHTDYGSGCGYVDIDFVSATDDVFAGDSFRQHLSLYDALMGLEGRGVRARLLAWHSRDVIAIEIDDRRADRGPVNIDLRMLRFALQYHAGANWDLTREHKVMVRNRSHTATSQLRILGQGIALSQVFQEDDHYCASAVAIRVLGRTAKARYANENTVRLTVPAGAGKYTILVASAATLSKADDVVASASANLAAAAVKGFEALGADNRDWWQPFWSSSFVRMHSADGAAEYVNQHYIYFQYVMACTSRGAHPPRYGGLIFYTTGDMREWGSQQWWHNLSCYYDALPPTNRFELMDPVFTFYSDILPACERAAREQWGSQGAYIPETTWFNGLEPLPADIAAEMRDLYLLRKPWEHRSARFMEFAETKHGHSSRWNWKAAGTWENGRYVWKDKGAGPFGEVNHIYSSGAKIANLYWLRYLYTGDREWLRNRAYPFIKDIAEFYRNHPKVRKDADGRIHIHDVNDHEPIKGAQDTLEEITAMHFIFPIAARASSILDVDSNLRTTWLEYAANLAPVPTNDLADSIGPRLSGEARMWSNGRLPMIAGKPTTASDHLLIPAIHYDLINVSTPDAETLRVANATFDSVYPGGTNEQSVIHVLSRGASAAAHLGRAQDVRHLIPNQIRSLSPDRDFCDWVGGGKTGVLPNRLTLREGPGSIDAQRLGRASAALHLALLQGVAPRPGEDPVIHVFPAWPKEWDVEFQLLTSGGFLVTASMRRSAVEFVELRSTIGGECRIRNPWENSGVAVYRDGITPAKLTGGLVRLDSTAGETILLVREGTSREQFRRSI